MACRPIGAKPLPEPKLDYRALRNKLQCSSNLNSNIFIKQNALENIACDMAAILSRPQCVYAVVDRLYFSDEMNSWYFGWIKGKKNPLNGSELFIEQIKLEMVDSINIKSQARFDDTC